MTRGGDDEGRRQGGEETRRRGDKEGGRRRGEETRRAGYEEGRRLGGEETRRGGDGGARLQAAAKGLYSSWQLRFGDCAAGVAREDDVMQWGR